MGSGAAANACFPRAEGKISETAKTV